MAARRAAATRSKGNDAKGSEEKGGGGGRRRKNKKAPHLLQCLARRFGECDVRNKLAPVATDVEACGFKVLDKLGCQFLQVALLILDRSVHHPVSKHAWGLQNEFATRCKDAPQFVPAFGFVFGFAAQYKQRSKRCERKEQGSAKKRSSEGREKKQEQETKTFASRGKTACACVAFAHEEGYVQQPT